MLGFLTPQKKTEQNFYHHPVLDSSANNFLPRGVISTSRTQQEQKFWTKNDIQLCAKIKEHLKFRFPINTQALGLWQNVHIQIQ